MPDAPAADATVSDGPLAVDAYVRMPDLVAAPDLWMFMPDLSADLAANAAGDLAADLAGGDPGAMDLASSLDLITSADLASPRDLAPPPADLANPRDLAPPPADLANPRDLTTPPDLVLPPDLSRPQPPMFALNDINPNSPTFGKVVSNASLIGKAYAVIFHESH